MDTDQENIDLFADAIDNVHSTAHCAMEVHIDGLEKIWNKRSCGPRMSDAKKIESLFSSINNVEALFALVDNVRH